MVWWGISSECNTSARSEQDSWFVVIVTGRDPLFPVFTPVEIPYIDLQTVVVEALAGIGGIGALLGEATPLPRTFPVRPFAVTNPIWVDTDGGGFDAPGVPDWAARRP